MFNFKGRRLFTFGCSMTYYNYPTWADILGHHYLFFENWGRVGQGNAFILTSIIECDKRNHFTPDDDIIVLWSGIDRIDFYQTNAWRSKLKAYPHNDPFSCCPTGYELMSAAYKSAGAAYLKEKNLNFKFMDWTGNPLNAKIAELFKQDFDNIQQVKIEYNKQKLKKTDYNAYQDFLIELYNRQSGPDWPTLNQILNGKHTVTDPYILKEIEDFKERITYHTDWEFNKSVLDPHPLPSQHLEFVKKYFPDFVVSPECLTWITDINDQILTGRYKGFKAFKPKERF